MISSTKSKKFSGSNTSEINLKRAKNIYLLQKKQSTDINTNLVLAKNKQEIDYRKCNY